MIVTSSAIKNGYFDDKYGKRGNDTEKKVPLLSFPFEIAEEPEGTVSYAWILKTKMPYRWRDFPGYTGWRPMFAKNLYPKTSAAKTKMLFRAKTAGDLSVTAE